VEGSVEESEGYGRTAECDRRLRGSSVHVRLRPRPLGRAAGDTRQPPSAVVRDKEASVAVPAHVFSAEGAGAEAPLTSEPPLPAAEPLTSEPPLADAEPMTSEHADAEADPTGLYGGPVPALPGLAGL